MNTESEHHEETVSKEQFAKQWLSDIVAGKPSSVELGHRFAQKLITQWLDVSENTDDLVYCDGAGDGGIDVAYLERGESTETDESETQGHTWYLVQSKYGTAFQGQKTLVDEGRKVIDTLDSRRPRLSALSDALLQRLTTFRNQASSRDRIVLVYATCEALTDEQKRAMSDVRAIGRARLGPMFDVESVSIETVYERNLENIEQARIRITLKANLVASGNELLVGSTPLLDLYTFLRTYRTKTEDLDRLYEKNVRKFLGMRGKVNKAIQETLDSNPERFGLYNNGITIVVEDFNPKGGDNWELKEPFIVNGCQTTRTIWEVFYRRLEAGGTGPNEALQQWQDRAEHGVVVTKVVKVGVEGEQLLEKITRNTNTQNAIREKDFLALTADFKTWQRAMEEIQDTYLEIQRGGWDSRRALQKQKPGIKQFSKVANAFDLLKVYGAGWLGEAGMAWGKNPPFLPNGSVFRRIVNATDLPDSERFGVADLYAAYQLQQAADDRDFGRGAAKVSRRQTRFLFYMVAIDLLRDALNRGRFPTTNKQVTRTLSILFAPATKNVADNLLDTAADAIDSYLTANTDDNIFDEPAFRAYNNDLNSFLKWEKLGKTEADCPRLRNLLAVTKGVMGKRIQGQSSIREDILKALESTNIAAPLLENGETIADQELISERPVDTLLETSTTNARQTKGLMFFCRRSNSDAKGQLVEDGFIVFKGSIASKNPKKSAKRPLIDRRSMLIKQGILKDAGTQYIFSEDYHFKTPSGAAAIVIGSNANGYVEWVTKDGRTLDEVMKRIEQKEQKGRERTKGSY